MKADLGRAASCFHGSLLLLGCAATAPSKGLLRSPAGANSLVMGIVVLVGVVDFAQHSATYVVKPFPVRKYRDNPLEDATPEETQRRPRVAGQVLELQLRCEV